MGRKSKKQAAPPLFEADEANAEKVGSSHVPWAGASAPRAVPPLPHGF
jgi:hypothetical protein